uniref:Uncharacterized protein n=1 Tax=Siphoviridae sp. ctES717 TaxID=2827564 RepID=A0A8S5RRY3_9CAUD|nr:MAG TPA: hypothetical protein [Siphoviridae sp. ctES717]
MDVSLVLLFLILRVPYKLVFSSFAYTFLRLCVTYL